MTTQPGTLTLRLRWRPAPVYRWGQLHCVQCGATWHARYADVSSAPPVRCPQCQQWTGTAEYREPPDPEVP